MPNDQSVFFLHTSILSAMLGASIGFAIQSGLQNPSAWTLVAILFLVLHAINFYHGKTVGVHDVNELIRADARPGVRGSLLFYNTILFLAFCVMAARIEDPWFIMWCVIAVRTLDIVGVAALLRAGDRSPGRSGIDASVRRQLAYWQAINVAVLAVFVGGIFVLPRLEPAFIYPVAVLMLATTTSVDLLLDYTMHSGNYFRRPADWSTLAERWDRLQGRHGDAYRVTVLHPFVEAWSRANGAERVVDLGSGNGCTARWLADKVGVDVLGIEKSEQLVSIADLYGAEGRGTVRYYCASVDDDRPQFVGAVQEFRREGPLTFLSLFAVQDCDSAQRFLTNVRALMSPGERLLVVFENASNFDPLREHATTIRTWKYSWRRSERLQVISWLPVSRPNPTSVCAEMGPDEGGVISTITRFRTARDYAGIASAAGFAIAGSGDVLLERQPSTPTDPAYMRAPKFAYLDLVAQAVHIPRQAWRARRAHARA